MNKFKEPYSQDELYLVLLNPASLTVQGNFTLSG